MSEELDYDEGKIDEVVLALMCLTHHGHARAWKGFDWASLDRLCEKGLIYDARNKAKSVMLTEEGLKQCEALFYKHFGLADGPRDGAAPS
nr:DUF6429 family protein [Verrucomicrobium sp. BvORR034]